ncbi:hypothetical protein [Geoglobus sp.]
MKILELYRIAKSFSGSPAELQSVLKELCEDVVSVGDDLSFVVRFGNSITVDESLLEELGGRRRKLYPFRNAWFFEKGYIAWDGRFLRISRELEEEVLKKILASLNVHG